LGEREKMKSEGKSSTLAPVPMLPGAEPRTRYIPDAVCAAAAVMFVLLMCLPFATPMWSNSPDTVYKPVWNWALVKFRIDQKDPKVVAWLWANLLLAGGLAVAWFGCRRLGNKARLRAALAAIPVYLFVRLPLDYVVMSWPRAKYFNVYLSLNKNPVNAIRMYSNPNTPLHYLVVLRVVLGAVAVGLPIAVYAWRRWEVSRRLGSDAWKVYTALALLVAFCLPFAKGTGRSEYAYNWSGPSAFRYPPEHFVYLRVGGFLLLFLAVVWTAVWWAKKDSFRVAVGAVAAYLALRLYYDLVSLTRLGGPSLRNPALFLPAFTIVLRVYLTTFGILYPLVCTWRDRWGVPGLKMSRLLLYGAAAACCTWIRLFGVYAGVITRSGEPVGWSAAWREPAVYAAVAPVAAIALYVLARLTVGAIRRDKGLAGITDACVRYGGILSSVLLVPSLMLRLSDWYPLLM